jgi:hypothetical protein
MEKKRAIIVTNTKDECSALHTFLGKEGWVKPDDHMNYNKEWIWVWDGKELSGQSGHNTLTHIVTRYSGYPIFISSKYITQ